MCQRRAGGARLATAQRSLVCRAAFETVHHEGLVNLVDRKLPAYRDEGEGIDVIAGVALVRRHSLVRHHCDLGVAGLPGCSFGFERVVDELDAFGLRLSPRAHVPMCPPIDMRGRLAEYWLFFSRNPYGSDGGSTMGASDGVPSDRAVAAERVRRGIAYEDAVAHAAAGRSAQGLPESTMRVLATQIEEVMARFSAVARAASRGTATGTELAGSGVRRGSGRFCRTGCRQVAWCRALSMFVGSLVDGGVDGKAGGDRWDRGSGAIRRR